MFDFVSFAETHSSAAVTIVILMGLCMLLVYLIIKHIVFKRILDESTRLEAKLDAVILKVSQIEDVNEIISKNVKDPTSSDGTIYHRDLLRELQGIRNIVCNEKCPNMILIVKNLDDVKRSVEEHARHNLDRLMSIEKILDSVHTRLDNWTAKLLELMQRIGGKRGYDE